MKTKIIAACSLILGMVALGCSKKNVLSCEDNIDQWAICNLKYYEKTATRSEIVALPLEKQKAIYRGLSAPSKIGLWHYKLEIVKEKGELSSKELTEYEKLINYLKPEHFITEGGKEELYLYATEWMKEMESTYGWDDEHFFEYLCSWMTEEELTRSIVYENLGEFPPRNEDDTIPGVDSTLIDVDTLSIIPCECHYSIFCNRKGYDECLAKNPKHQCEINDGCGIFGNYNCDGICFNY